MKFFEEKVEKLVNCYEKERITEWESQVPVVDFAKKALKTEDLTD